MVVARLVKSNVLIYLHSAQSLKSAKCQPNLTSCAVFKRIQIDIAEKVRNIKTKATESKLTITDLRVTSTQLLKTSVKALGMKTPITNQLTSDKEPSMQDIPVAKKSFSRAIAVTKRQRNSAT